MSEVRCPKCHRLLCEGVSGTDFRMQFTCTNTRCRYKFIVVVKDEVMVG